MKSVKSDVAEKKEKVKKPLSAYNFFFVQERKQLKDEQPQLSNQEMMQVDRIRLR